LKESGVANSGFDFLGHRMTLGPAGVTVEPASLERLIDKQIPVLDWLENYKKHLETCDPDIVTDWLGEGTLDTEACCRLADYKALVDAWANAFSECDDIGELKLKALDDFEPYREKLKMSWEALKEYQSSSLKWKIYSG
jgi:hypothetical protein